jgi:hypothetical protein
MSRFVLISITIRHQLLRGADKILAFLIFLFAAQPKDYFFDGLKKLEHLSHNRVELGGGGNI